MSRTVLVLSLSLTVLCLVSCPNPPGAGDDRAPFGEDDGEIPETCSADDECPGDMACVGLACVEPVSDLEAYAAEAGSRPSSYVLSVQFPALYPEPELCCFDQNGDGRPDDTYGTLLSLQADSGDCQADMDSWIADGTIVKVVDWIEFPDHLADGSVRLSVFDGDPVSFDPGVFAAGSGHVLLDPASFGDYGALCQLNSAVIEGGTLMAHGNMVMLLLPNALAPGAARPVELPIYDVKLVGPLRVGVESDGRVGVCSVGEARGDGDEVFEAAGLQLGGSIDAVELLAALDEELRNCACRNIDPAQPVVQWDFIETVGVMDIYCTENTGYDDGGTCEDGGICSALQTICSYLGIMGGAFDVDRDRDGINESISIGLRVGICGVSVDGLGY